MRAHTTQPKILFCLACRSWNDWLPYFLRCNSFSTETLYLSPTDDSTQLKETLSSARYQGIVFLSHHETLERDFALTESLSTLHSGIPIVAHNRISLELGLDKQLLQHYFSSSHSFKTIPDFSLETALEHLCTGENKALVIKPKRGTEGQGQAVITSATDPTLLGPNLLASHIIQPCIFGTEFSVNVLGDGTRYSLYEPVFKDRITLDYIHPCRRYREFPAHDSGITEQLMNAAREIVEAIRPIGLLELEFIVSMDNEVHLVELNPRLSATMRMVSRASEQNIFSTLGLIALGEQIISGRVPTNGFSVEFPISKEQSSILRGKTSQEEKIDLSSRITVTSSTREEARHHAISLCGERHIHPISWG